MADPRGPERRETRAGRPRDTTLDEAIIVATRRRLVEDGYSRMHIGDIAADAGTTRPTVYRRWADKFQLVMDALDWGFQAQRDSYPTSDLAELEPRTAVTEAIRRLDPAYFNADAMVLMGNFMGEARRTPELLAMVRDRAVNPRVALLEELLIELQAKGAVHDDVDVHIIATMCFGAYFGAFLREDRDHDDLAERVCAAIWPAIAARPAPAVGDDGNRRRGRRGGHD